MKFEFEALERALSHYSTNETYYILLFVKGERGTGLGDEWWREREGERRWR